MGDIAAVGIALAKTLIENPIIGPAIMGAVRTATGFLQKKYKEKLGEPFDKQTFVATLIKYELAINAVSAIIPDRSLASALVLIADIAGSWANKIKNNF